MFMTKKGETTLFITDLEKSNILVPKTIAWDQVKLPEVWTLEQAVPHVKEPPRQVESILQYLDGDKVRLNLGETQRPYSARSSTSKVPISDLEKEQQRDEILRINQPEYKVEMPESSYKQRDNSPTPSDMGYGVNTIIKELYLPKKIQKMFNNSQNKHKKQWFLSYHTLKKKKWYLKNYMFYCEKIREIVDFFQWIEEAHYELKKDFPNFNNSSQITVIESTYQTYITAKRKPIQYVHPPCASLIMKTAEDRVIDAIPFKHGIANDGITHNNYTNMCMQSISKQTSRIEEAVSKLGRKNIEKGESSKIEDSVPFKPPPSFENEKFHLNSKKDSEFVEELIVRLQKIKVEEQKTQVAITTFKGGHSDNEMPNEDVEVNRISNKGNKIPKQYSKPYFPRPSPMDIQFEEKADFA
ncbi:hypothetical protein CDL12_10453 [Handroanthus impetiginosus]|uniref:DUF7588 domain-containing protein n=1 Tax=Handroanthus impetiginosus TaxID=429701 RepID=A0A2G9HHA6_9LAMI|nr:hypothetical protein CDL12_10453 [Handroanthus impetiginosus]